MKRYSAALLAMSLLLAGCGGDSKAGTSSSPPTESSPPTASPTAIAAPKTDPTIPAAARAQTPAGAEAFVRHFYSQLNVAWSKPQAGLISGLSAKTCKTCAALEQSAVDLASKHQHYQGDVFAVGTVDSIGESKILVVGEQPIGAVIDIKGSVVTNRTKAQKSKFVVAVAWSSGAWLIHEMKVLK